MIHSCRFTKRHRHDMHSHNMDHFLPGWLNEFSEFNDFSFRGNMRVLWGKVCVITSKKNKEEIVKEKLVRNSKRLVRKSKPCLFRLRHAWSLRTNSALNLFILVTKQFSQIILNRNASRFEQRKCCRRDMRACTLLSTVRCQP
jgi:hypothetical protein